MIMGEDTGEVLINWSKVSVASWVNTGGLIYSMATGI